MCLKFLKVVVKKIIKKVPGKGVTGGQNLECHNPFHLAGENVCLFAYQLKKPLALGICVIFITFNSSGLYEENILMLLYTH